MDTGQALLSPPTGLLGGALAAWAGTAVVYRLCALEHVRVCEGGEALAWAALGACALRGALPQAWAVAVVLVVGLWRVRESNIVGPAALPARALAGLRGRVVVVTGVSKGGIGFDTALSLGAAGARLVLCCRDVRAGGAGRRAQAALAARLRRAPEEIGLEQLDLASVASVRRCASRIAQGYGVVDVLVNNSGMMSPERCETEDGFEAHLQVNCLGTWLLTVLLLPALRCSSATGGADAPGAASGPARYSPAHDQPEPARVVFVNSTMHKACRPAGQAGVADLLADANLAGAGFGMFRAYGQSKWLLMALAADLARRLGKGGAMPLADLAVPVASTAAQAPRRVSVLSVHPGTIRTAISRNMPWWAQLGHKWVMPLLSKNTEQGARTTVFAAAAPQLDRLSGAYLEHCELAPRPPALDLYGAAVTEWAEREVRRAIALVKRLD
jgi:NAD(P)-dependent dehydrogenase (short-subunit alcohol dehydrogenase family)